MEKIAIVDENDAVMEVVESDKFVIKVLVGFIAFLHCSCVIMMKIY